MLIHSWSRRGAVALAAVGILAAAGCGSSSKGSASPTTAATTPPPVSIQNAKLVTDPCKLLGDDQVSTLLGAPIVVRTSNGTTNGVYLNCTWEGPLAQPTHQVNLRVSTNTSTYDLANRAPLHPVTVNGIGDKAAFVEIPQHKKDYEYTQISTVKDGVYVQLVAGGPLTGTDAQTPLTAGLKQIVQRLNL